jgi:hypothetical protein
MELFNLPPATKVQRVVPKNAFDAYTTAKQKKAFVNHIQRITWTNKIATDTVNLSANEIREIQIFRVELKSQIEVKELLEVIDRAIPYAIIFVVEFEDYIYFSTSSKHPHPANEDAAVLDWTFNTDWFLWTENRYSLTLKKSVDEVYRDFCVQLSGNIHLREASLSELVKESQVIESLKKEATRLESAISRCKQYNRKVELNMQLLSLQKKIQSLSKIS